MKTVITAILLAGAALPGVAARAQNAPVMFAPFEGTRLDIVATGESRQTPDIAVISAGVVTEAATAQAALSENNRKMQAVFAALARAGIAERDIQTSSINLNPQYEYIERESPRLTGYNASNQLSVRFRDIERAGAVIDALVAQGANQINGPSLQIDEPEAALNDARRDALRQARERAEIYAAAAGMRVVRIVAISEQGAAQPPMPMMMRMQAESVQDAGVQIAPGEQRLSATVSVTFELE